MKNLILFDPVGPFDLEESTFSCEKSPFKPFGQQLDNFGGMVMLRTKSNGVFLQKPFMRGMLPHFLIDFTHTPLMRPGFVKPFNVVRGSSSKGFIQSDF